SRIRCGTLVGEKTGDAHRVGWPLDKVAARVPLRTQKGASGIIARFSDGRAKALPWRIQGGRERYFGRCLTASGAKRQRRKHREDAARCTHRKEQRVDRLQSVSEPRPTSFRQHETCLFLEIN